MTSQRKFKRIQLITMLDVLCASDLKYLGVVVDITTEGLGARLSQEAEKGRCYSLRIVLPTELGGRPNLDVTARCARCKRSSNPDLFEVGFEFVDISPDGLEVVEELIRRYRR